MSSKHFDEIFCPDFNALHFNQYVCLFQAEISAGIKLFVAITTEKWNLANDKDEAAPMRMN